MMRVNRVGMPSFSRPDRPVRSGRDPPGRASCQHEPGPHRAQRGHDRAAAVPARVPVAAVRTGRPRGRRAAPRRARRDGLRRRLRGPPLPPGERSGQGARPDRRPAAVHRRGRWHHAVRRRAAVVLAPRAGPRGAGRRGPGRPHAAGHEALRRVLVGQGRHVGPDGRGPGVPPERSRRRRVGLHAGGGVGLRPARARAELLRGAHLHPADEAQPGRGKGHEAGGGRMKAVIMAGGEGTRLRPLTSNTPKPLLSIAGRPMMEHVIQLLRRHGITDIVVTVAFMANAIRDYFGDGSEFGVQLRYVDEPSPLGTAGSVRNAASLLTERFIVLSGDVITDVDLSHIVEFHVAREALATIGLTPVDRPLDFGIVITRDDGSIDRCLEKPTWGQVFSDTINTGIYVLEPEILDLIEPARPVDFSAEVFPMLLRDGLPLYGAVAHGYWEDVGTIDAYLRAHKDVLDQMVHLDIPGFQVADGVWVGEGTEIAPDVETVGPAVIGPDCTIESGTRLGAYTVLGSHCRVLANVHIDRSVVHDSVYIGPGGRLRGVVVGKSANLRAHV